MSLPLLEVPSIGEFSFYQLIYGFLRDEIRDFGLAMMGRMMAWIGGLALSLLTLWVLLQGYLIAMGQVRETLTGLIFRSMRATLIVAVATAMSVGGVSLHQFFTTNLNAEIHQVVTGEEGTAAKSVDRSLAYMQIATAGIDALKTEGDGELETRKVRALWMAGLGSAGPAISAAAMLLMFEMAMALFVGFGPLFVMALLFRSTTPLFHKWLHYGIGTLFSLAVFSFVADVALRLSIAVAEAFWASRFIEIGTGLNFDEGITNQALQQGGLGLLLTVLIISAPPMAAMFFQGSLGQFMPHAAFGQGRNAIYRSSIPTPGKV